MRKILLILACVATATKLITAYSVHKKDCDNNDPENGPLAKVCALSQKIEDNFFQYLYHKSNGSRSISMSGISGLTILTLLAMHNSGDNDAILEYLDVRDIEEAKELSRCVVDMLEQSKGVTQKYKILTDSSNKFTDIFLNNFAELCNGVIKYINFNNNREVEANVKKWYLSPENKHSGLNNCNKKNGLVITTGYSINIDYSFVPNTVKRKLVAFHVSPGKVVRTPGYSAILYGLYGEDREWGVQYMKANFNGGNSSVLYALPRNSADMPRVIEKLNNPILRKKIIDSLKPMYIEVITVQGAAFMQNNLIPHISKNGINLDGYQNVLKGKLANVKVFAQDINITLKQFEPQVKNHSPSHVKCQAKLLIDRQVAYKIFVHDLPYIMGVFNLEANGEFA